MIHTMFTEVFEVIGDLYTKPRELAAIWLTEAVETSAGRTVRIAPDMYITLTENNKIAKSGAWTHKVILCVGTLVSQFEITCICIHTGEPTIVHV